MDLLITCVQYIGKCTPAMGTTRSPLLPPKNSRIRRFRSEIKHQSKADTSLQSSQINKLVVCLVNWCSEQ